MDKAIIDSSVAIKWFVVEPYSDDARRVLNEYQAGTLSLLAPDLIYAEVGNIVWKKQRFQGLAADAPDCSGSGKRCPVRRCRHGRARRFESHRPMDARP